MPFAKNLLSEFTGNPGADEETLQALETDSKVPLSDDYRSFLKQVNGGEGFIGKHYLILWKAEEVTQLNRDYQVGKYAPGLLFFASDGGGDGFDFDTRTAPYRVMEVPFVGMSVDAGFFVAESFSGLLERMHQTDGPLF